MLDDKELLAALDASPAELITVEYITSRIRDVTFRRPTDGTLMLCIITLDNSFSVSGESACVDPANFSREIGEKIAYDNAFSSLWPLFGFLLAETKHHRKRGA